MIVPKSILNPKTESYDKVWVQRLNNLDIDSLLINIESERDPVKLEYWLEMFAIDTSIFDFNLLNEAQRRLLIQNWINILIHSGTEYSIKQMAMVMGATNCDIFYGDALLYDGVAKYDGMYLYDAGTSTSQFSIHVHVYGIPFLDRPKFDQNFRKLMRAIQPVRIYLKLLKFI